MRRHLAVLVFAPAPAAARGPALGAQAAAAVVGDGRTPGTR